MQKMNKLQVSCVSRHIFTFYALSDLLEDSLHFSLSFGVFCFLVFGVNGVIVGPLPVRPRRGKVSA